MISDSIRTKSNKISLVHLKSYFDKILIASKSKKIADIKTLKQILGRRWLYNFICHKDIRAIFSKYFWIGVASTMKSKT